MDKTTVSNGNKTGAALEISALKAQMAALERFKKEIVKPFYEEYEICAKALHEKIGTNAFFQDETGTVFKTVEIDGMYMKFVRFGINRTRYADEKKGSLSMTEAREAGFTLEGK